MKWFAVFATLILASPAFAQQLSPAEAALQASTIVNQLGQMATQQQKTVEQLQAQLVALIKERDELKAKLEAKEKENAK